MDFLEGKVKIKLIFQAASHVLSNPFHWLFTYFSLEQLVDMYQKSPRLHMLFP